MALTTDQTNAINAMIQSGASPDDILAATQAAAGVALMTAALAAMPAVPASFDVAEVAALKAALQAVLAAPVDLPPLDQATGLVAAMNAADPANTWKYGILTIAAAAKALQITI